jgi:hypothetical protein
LNNLEQLGIKIITTEQDYNATNRHNLSLIEWKLNLTKILQEIQNYHHRRPLQKGHALNRIRGLPPPGKAPYGYRRGKDKYIIDRSTAPVVKDFCERFLLFGSLRGTVRYLEKKYGKKISVSTGRRWLTNPVYRGDLAYQNGEVISDTHIPIISREEAAQIDRLLRRNRRLAPRTASAPRSLSGLLVCYQCQSAMKITRVTRRDKKQEYLYLRPINCPLQTKCSSIPYQQVLEQTITKICEDLPQAVAKLNMPPLEKVKEDLTSQISQKQEILSQLPMLQEQRILDAETSQLRSYKLRLELAQLREKLAQLPPVNLKLAVQAISLPQFWLDLSESERRFYFREFIRQIKIKRNSPKNWQLHLVFIF